MKKCSVCLAYQSIDRFPGNAKQSICTECKNASLRKNYAKIREAVVKMLGGSCSCCGEQEYVFLDIDHIANDGNIDRKKSTTNSTWRTALVEPERFQILCRNCNWAKHMGGCPHAQS